MGEGDFLPIFLSLSVLKRGRGGSRKSLFRVHVHFLSSFSRVCLGLGLQNIPQRPPGKSGNFVTTIDIRNPFSG